MQTIESAERIVDIQTALEGSLDHSVRVRLTAEQRELWDTEHPGRAYEEIRYDVWAFRRYPPA